MRVLFWLGLVLSWGLLSGPSEALAYDPGGVSLGFESSYVDPGGAARTHHGVDVDMPAGASVSAPLEGTVTFAGRVPASSGGTCLAVTLETSMGRVSLMPLEAVSVRQGDHVAEGEGLGVLAAVGDASGAASHVHLSLRVGGEYVNPAPLLSAAPPVETPASPVAVSPDPASVAAPVSGGVAVPAAAGVPGVCAQVAGTSVSGALDTGGAAAIESARVVDPACAGTAVSVTDAQDRRAGEGAPTEAIAMVPRNGFDVLSAAVRPALEGAASITGKCVSGLVGTVGRGIPPTALIWMSFVALAVTCDRTFVESVSDRLGTLLRQLRAGAMIRGLTSCSG